MARDINISIIAKDNYSQAVKTMRDTTQKFNKDLDAMKSKIDTVSKTKITIKTDTTKAREELKRLQASMVETRKSGNDLSKVLGSVNIATSKLNNKSISNMEGFLKKYASAGGSQLAIDTFAKGATTYMGSALGSEGGTLFGNSLSMGITGAQMGAFGGIVGIAVGGAIGAGLGLINGTIENYAKKDDAFKEFVSSQYQGILQERSKTLANASNLAASRKDPENQSSLTNKSKELSNEQDKANLAMGASYNKAKVEGQGGLQDQVDFYKNYGDDLQDVNSKIGKYQAYLENKKSDLQMNSKEVLFGGSISADMNKELSGDERKTLLDYQQQYAEAEKQSETASTEEERMRAIAKMQELLEATEAFATNVYAGSEPAQIEQDSNEALIGNLQKSAEISKAGWENVYEIKNELTKGMASVQNNPMAQFYPTYGGYSIPYKENTSTGKLTSSSKAHAYGLGYVPYNNFPALLHEGERVLTASENRGYGSGSGVTITGNNFTVREEADINKIARALFGEIEKARMVMAS